MSRAVYSKTLFGPAVIASGSFGTAVVPAGKVWKVTFVSAMLSGGGSGYLEVLAPAGSPVFQRLPVTAGTQSYSLPLSYVLTAGETLFLYANGTGLVVYASGYELTS